MDVDYFQIFLINVTFYLQLCLKADMVHADKNLKKRIYSAPAVKGISAELSNEHPEQSHRRSTGSDTE